jgi:hypothetical protein
MGRIWRGSVGSELGQPNSGASAREGRFKSLTSGGRRSAAWAAEAVRGDVVCPIRTRSTVEGRRLPRDGGAGETLALATGKAGGCSPRGVECGWGCCRAAAVSLEARPCSNPAGSGSCRGGWSCSSTMVSGLH